MTLRPGSTCAGARRDAAGDAPTARAAALRSTLLAALLMAGAAGCGGGSSSAASAAPSGPGEGSTLASGTADVPVVTTTTLVPEGPIGPPVAPLAPAADIQGAVEEASGPTSDVSAEMSRFGPFPAVTTPPGAVLTELRAEAGVAADPRYLLVTTEATLRVPESLGSLTRFFADDGAARGWTPTRAPVPAGPSDPHRLGFKLPDSTYPLDDLTVTVTAADQGQARARIHYVSQVPATDTTVLQRFRGWAADLPLPPGGVVTGAGIQTAVEGRPSLWFSLSLTYPEGTPADVANGLRAALPTDRFSVVPRPPSGDTLDDWVYLASPYFADARVSPRQVPGRATTVAVDARVPFVLR